MPNDTIPLPEPAYYQWRRRSMPWSLEFAFTHMCHATTEDSEIRTLHPADQMHAHATAVSAAKDARIKVLEERVLVLTKLVDASEGGVDVDGVNWFDLREAARAALGDKT